MYDKVFLNEYGFYELKKKPSLKSMKEDFEGSYYQESKGNYEQKYTKTEKNFFNIKYDQKKRIIESHVHFSDNQKKSLLDIGCGEGYALKYFYENGYKVLGIDFSRHGITNNNPDMLPFFCQGDCVTILKNMVSKGEKFDVINMDQSLDMMLEPEKVLKLCKNILQNDGVMIIKVANNYSVLQEYLIKTQKVDREFWLDEEGHPYYFNKEGLIKFLNAFGYRCENVYGESFIDFNLLNDKTNYYRDKTVGKSCYYARIELELLMEKLSEEKTLEIYRLLGEMGLGREIMGVFKKEM